MRQQELKLLGHPRLKAGESLPSFIIRVSKSNFYEPPRILMGLIHHEQVTEVKDSSFCPREAATFERLAELTQTKAKHLYASTAHMFARLLMLPDDSTESLVLETLIFPVLSVEAIKRLLRSETAGQFCPLCLARSAYHRSIWLPTVVSLCLEHSCLLVDRCSICGKAVSIESIVNSHCASCNADLRQAQRIMVEDEIGLLTQRTIQLWLRYKSPPYLRQYSIPECPPSILFRVIEGLRFAVQKLAVKDCPRVHILPVWHDILKSDYKIGSSSLTSYQSYCVYTTAFRGITDWPVEFYKFLDALASKQEGTIRTGGVHQDLGNLYTGWLEHNWQHDSFNFIQHAFDLYLVEHYGLSQPMFSLDRLSRYPQLADGFTYVSINQASEMLGVAPSIIQKFILCGQLKTVKGNREDVLFVRRTELLELQNSWRFSLNLKELAQKLGISENIVLNMVEIDIFSVVQGPAQGFSQWKFGTMGAQEFLEKIRTYTEVCAEDEMGFAPITIGDASRITAIIGLNIASILKRVAEGLLHAYSFSKVISCGSLLFNPADIQVCINTIKSENGWIEREGVTKRLKVKDVTLAKWVKAELLCPIATRASAQYFDINEVERFLAIYVTSQEAATLLGVGELTIQTWVRQGRLQAVSGPGVDECHAYLFDKEALLKWRDERVNFGEALALLGVSRATLHTWITAGKIYPLNDMGGKQRWLSKRDVLALRKEVEAKFAIRQAAREQKLNSLLPTYSAAQRDLSPSLSHNE